MKHNKFHRAMLGQKRYNFVGPTFLKMAFPLDS